MNVTYIHKHIHTYIHTYMHTCRKYERAVALQARTCVKEEDTCVI